MIQFKNVSKRFKSKDVIENLNLHIAKGELVVLIGPSGCGKTTTLKMINRLIENTSGEILIDNKNIFDQDVISLRRKMGYVIQQTGLFPHMTIRENIEIIPRLQKDDPTKIATKTIELMEMVGLSPDDYLDQFPSQLSGGQQQRVGVARAFATDPEIILMDEPFSALDPITRTQLQQELVHLQQQFHKTIVFVTHDMDEAIEIADRICILNEGNIVQYDTPENILKNPANDFVRNFVGENRIWSAPEFIRARDIMLDIPVVCMNTTLVSDCIEKMHEKNVETMLIVDNENNLIGSVAAQHINHAPANVAVSEVMNQVVVTATPEESIVDILRNIQGKQTANIPVIDGDGHLVGLITKTSLITTLSHQFLDKKGDM